MSSFSKIVALIVFNLFPALALPREQRIVIDPIDRVYLSRYDFLSLDKRPPLKDFSKIFLYDSKSKSYSNYFIMPDYSECYSIHELTLDHTGSNIAFCSYCKLPAEAKKQNQDSYYRISVLDIKSRKNIIDFDHGHRFLFSPQGDAILFVTDYPGSFGGEASPPPGFEGGIFLYNFASKTKKEISSPVGACGFNWSPHDGNIYLTNSDNRVFRFDVSKNQGEIVPFKGIYFSPDGKYNISDVCGERDDVDAYPHIYRISDKKKMTEWTNLILKKSGQWPPPQYNRPALSFEFFCEKLKAAVFSVNEKNFVFDLSKGTVIGEFTGMIQGTNPDGSLVLINPIKADNPQQIDHSQVKIINLLDLIKK